MRPEGVCHSILPQLPLSAKSPEVHEDSPPRGIGRLSSFGHCTGRRASPVKLPSFELALVDAAVLETQRAGHQLGRFTLAQEAETELSCSGVPC